MPELLLFVTVTLLLVALLSVIPVIVSVLTLSNKFTLPLVVLVALKLVTTFVAVSNNVPVLVLVVNKPPVMIPELVCVI